MRRIVTLVAVVLLMVASSTFDGIASTASAMALTPGTSTAQASPDAFGFGTGTCTKHGQFAGTAPNQLSGALYGEVPIGGPTEACGLVVQVWTTHLRTERFIFFVPAGSVVWISHFSGGSAWFFDPNVEDVMSNLNRQHMELELRDGPMPTTISVLPSQSFRLVTRFRSF